MELGGGERKRVVVIGGGVAGSLLAKSLQFNADFTLIDQYASSPSLSLSLPEMPFSSIITLQSLFAFFPNLVTDY